MLIASASQDGNSFYKGVVSVEKADPNYTIYFYATSIGSMIAFILLLLLFIHILYHYIIILFLFLCIISMIMSLDNGLIKSNYFTQIQFTNHKKTFCYIAYYLDIGTLQFHQLIMYALFIHRIQIVFQDTIYSYSKRTFIYIYSSLFLGYFIIGATMGAAHKYSKFIIYYFESENNLYCRTSTETNSNVFSRISIWVYSLWQIALNIICVYMLVNRLWSLKKRLMEQFAAKIDVPMRRVQSDTIDEPTVTSTNLKVEVPSADCKRTNSLDIIKPQHSVQITMDEIKEEIKKGDKDAGRIIALHKLIKKFIFLVIMSILSWILFAVLIKISRWFWSVKLWFIVSNDVLVWLMFAHTQKYWDYIANCCSCYCCLSLTKFK